MLVKDPEKRISWEDLFKYSVSEYGDLEYDGDIN
jgi:hypothetical protein